MEEITFGYIVVNKAELKYREFDCYHSFYCGLCRQLKANYGLCGQMTLTYDMTFLAMLLTGLYEPETKKSSHKCILHPFEKRTVCENLYIAYAADMNVILSYYKYKDDWKDERKWTKGVSAKLLERDMQRLWEQYKEKLERIEMWMAELTAKEKEENTEIDLMAGMFGKILGEVFVCQQDEWEEELRKVGFYLGKFIYLSDAYEDIEEDIKKNLYNSLKNRYGTDGFEKECKELLTMMIANCCREFEKLPILENVEILRNILYSRVWYRYEITKEKRYL